MPRKRNQKATGGYRRQKRGKKSLHTKRPLKLPPELKAKIKR